MLNFSPDFPCHFPLTPPLQPRSPNPTRTAKSTKKPKANSPPSENSDLASLASLGHFLKGSSATLGLTKVKDSCERIQHFGQKKDESGTVDEPDEKVCLKRIKETLKEVKEQYQEVEGVLRKFYA